MLKNIIVKHNYRFTTLFINRLFIAFFITRKTFGKTFQTPINFWMNSSKTENQKQEHALDTRQLVSELDTLKNFDWGGDYQNSLDKYLVSRYLKVHKSFDTLISKLETEIKIAVQGYVLNSWYNHWSRILIEHIF